MVVIQHRQLVAHVNQGNATKPADHGVQHVDPGHRQIDGLLVLLLKGQLQARERRQAAGNAAVPRGRIGLEHQPTGERPREFA